ncbi:hypothetical protein [Actinospica robiniae]|uniref:hypothetical protein n=1 Tax=Actinospica robiniae TaxID=304901 RepID=UPI0012F9C3F5|nr:hypothetical protein [Actinospica robiniae]
MDTAHLFPVLAAIGRDFAELCERGGLGEMPSVMGLVPLTDVSAYLTCPLTDDVERDALWRRVIELGRRPDTQAESWRLVALGLALPRLIHIALRARDRNHVHPAETDEMVAEMLAAFAQALAMIDLGPDHADHADLINWRLARAAAAGAQRVADRRTAHCRRTADNAEAHLPEPAAGTRTHPTHPDIALARLVAAGVIDIAEAELIGRHRIERVTLRQLCLERGWYPMQGTRALRAAEEKVACALGAVGVGRIHQTDERPKAGQWGSRRSTA